MEEGKLDRNALIQDNSNEPNSVTRDDDQQVSRVRKQGLNTKCTCKRNAKLLLYIGVALTLLLALIGLAVSISEAQNNASLKEDLLNAAQKISSLEESTLQNVSSLNKKLANTIQKVSVLEVAIFNHCLGSEPDSPAISCQQVLDCNPIASQGYYWIGTADEDVKLQFCDMERTCGGVTGGWLHLISLDMREFGTSCPTGLTLRTHLGKKLCGKPQGASAEGCGSVLFNTIGEYDKVCGMIIGYQYGNTDSFRAQHISIDGAYLDGVSLTHGENPRHHIWSFAAALDEVGTYPPSNCPCISGTSATPPLVFVGNDYFCDTGSSSRFVSNRFYGDDPLWDGAGCESTSVTCCSFNNPPWFYKQLSASTDNNMEMRVCANRVGVNGAEDVLIEQIEIYVH